MNWKYTENIQSGYEIKLWKFDSEKSINYIENLFRYIGNSKCVDLFELRLTLRNVPSFEVWSSWSIVSV